MRQRVDRTVKAHANLCEKPIKATTSTRCIGTIHPSCHLRTITTCVSTTSQGRVQGRVHGRQLMVSRRGGRQPTASQLSRCVHTVQTIIHSGLQKSESDAVPCRRELPTALATVRDVAFAATVEVRVRGHVGMDRPLTSGSCHWHRRLSRGLRSATIRDVLSTSREGDQARCCALVALRIDTCLSTSSTHVRADGEKEDDRTRCALAHYSSQSLRLCDCCRQVKVAGWIRSVRHQKDGPAPARNRLYIGIADGMPSAWASACRYLLEPSRQELSNLA